MVKIKDTADFYVKQLEVLVGETVEGVVTDEEGQFFGLRIGSKILWLLSDDEGNEPGSFEIQG